MSDAIAKFKSSLALSESLLIIERENYTNPPKSDEQSRVQGLRGGAAILMVASFENFLKELNRTNLVNLVASPPIIDFSKLPEKMRVKSIYYTLESSMKGLPFQPKKDRIDRLDEIVRSCNLVTSTTINVDAFTETGSNPNSMRVKEIFKNIGIDDVFKKIEVRFQTEWREPIPSSLIESKLDEIIGRRHIVAHTANALTITRNELKSSIRFLKILANRLDVLYREHIRSLQRSAAII